MKQLTIRENIAWNSIGSSIYLLCQWLCTVFVVRLAGFEQAGYLSLAISLSNPFICIANYGMRSYQVSDTEEADNDRTYILSRMISCATSFALCVAFLAVRKYSLEQTLCILLYILYRLSEAFVDVYQGISQRAGRMDGTGISLGIRGLFSAAAFYFVLLAVKSLPWAIFSMAVVCYMIVFIFDVPFTHKVVKFTDRAEPKAAIALLRRCAPLLLYSILSVVIMTIPRYCLELYHGSEVLGLYSSVATPTVIVQVAATYIFSPTLTAFANHYANNDKRQFMKMFYIVCAFIVAIGALAMAVAALFAKEGLTILFSERIEQIMPYAYMLYPLIGCTILTALSLFLCAILTVIRRFGLLVIGNAIGLAVCAFLSVPLISRYSMDGCNMVCLIALSVQTMILGVFTITSVKRAFAADQSCKL